MRYGFYIEAEATKRIQSLLEAVLKLMLSKKTKTNVLEKYEITVKAR